MSTGNQLSPETQNFLSKLQAKGYNVDSSMLGMPSNTQAQPEPQAQVPVQPIPEEIPVQNNYLQNSVNSSNVYSPSILEAVARQNIAPTQDISNLYSQAPPSVTSIPTSSNNRSTQMVDMNSFLANEAAQSQIQPNQEPLVNQATSEPLLNQPSGTLTPQNEPLLNQTNPSFDPYATAQEFETLSAGEDAGTQDLSTKIQQNPDYLMNLKDIPKSVLVQTPGLKKFVETYESKFQVQPPTEDSPDKGLFQNDGSIFTDPVSGVPTSKESFWRRINILTKGSLGIFSEDDVKNAIKNENIKDPISLRYILSDPEEKQRVLGTSIPQTGEGMNPNEMEQPSGAEMDMSASMPSVDQLYQDPTSRYNNQSGIPIYNDFTAPNYGNAPQLSASDMMLKNYFDQTYPVQAQVAGVQPYQSPDMQAYTNPYQFISQQEPSKLDRARQFLSRLNPLNPLNRNK